MTDDQIHRLDALPYGKAFTVDEALAVLEAASQEQLQNDPVYRIRQDLVLQTAWDPSWNAGSWVSNRIGSRPQVQALREHMTDEQLVRLDSLPYGPGHIGV